MPRSTFICQACGTTFTARRANAKYCSFECYQSTRNTAETRFCLHCGKPFKTYPYWTGKYCSISCGVSARNLTNQNPSFHRDISGKNNPMYGKGYLLRGARNPMYGKRKHLSPAWKGGVKRRPDGYVRVIAPDDHPYPCENSKGTKYILEHRLVMERRVGRYLYPEEVVHHIDSNPSNNDIDNLQLFASQAEHISIAHAADPQSAINGTRRYRLKRRSKPQDFSADDWQQCLEYWHYCCVYCGHQRGFWNDIQAEHFIPVSADNFPGTIPSNMLPACRECNQSKGDTLAEIWLIKKFGPKYARIALKRIQDYFDSLA